MEATSLFWRRHDRVTRAGRKLFRSNRLQNFIGIGTHRGRLGVER